MRAQETNFNVYSSLTRVKIILIIAASNTRPQSKITLDILLLQLFCGLPRCAVYL